MDEPTKSVDKAVKALKWRDHLIREAEIAYERGEQVTFAVSRREGKRHWKIYRKRLVTSGEEEFEEEG